MFMTFVKIVSSQDAEAKLPEALPMECSTCQCCVQLLLCLTAMLVSLGKVGTLMCQRDADSVDEVISIFQNSKYMTS